MVILFDISHKRGDFLRPVTGWRAEPAERHEWEQGRRGGRVVRAWLSPRVSRSDVTLRTLTEAR